MDEKKDKVEKKVTQKVAEELVETQKYDQIDKPVKPASRYRFRFVSLHSILYLLLSIGLVVMCVALVQVVSVWWSDVGHRRNTQAEWLPKEQPVPTSTPVPTAVDSDTASTSAGLIIPGPNLQVFMITISATQEATLPTAASLTSMLKQSLGLNTKVTGEYVFKVYYDTDLYGQTFSAANKFNSSYLVLVSDGVLTPGPITANGLRLVIEPYAEQYVPFLENVKYCKEDSDCRIRGHFCTYGSFNKYQLVDESVTCAGAVVSEQDEEFGVYDTKLQCITQLEFSGSQCQDNRCVGNDKQIVCKR